MVEISSEPIMKAKHGNTEDWECLLKKLQARLRIFTAGLLSALITKQ